MSSPSTTPIVDKIGKLEKLIIEGKVTLVDDDSKPLKKVEYPRTILIVTSRDWKIFNGPYMTQNVLNILKKWSPDAIYKKILRTDALCRGSFTRALIELDATCWLKDRLVVVPKLEGLANGNSMNDFVEDKIKKVEVLVTVPLKLIVFAMLAACASRAVETLSATSFLMVA
ncbi:hypothetical protein Tco_0796125 [Tanacetum coccineum]